MEIAKLTKIIETIKKEYESCTLCPMQCRVNRMKDIRGACGVGRDSKVFNTTLLVNDDDKIVPTYGIYFAGCNLNCRFCSVAEQNALISTGKEKTQIITEKNYTGNHGLTNTGLARNNKTMVGIDFVEVNDKFVERVRKEMSLLKPKTISFIGGEPSVHLLTIFELIEKLLPRIPLIFFTNLYYNSRINRILSEWFEYIVADMHFGNNNCARMITDKHSTLMITDKEITWIITDYWETVTRNVTQLRNKIILRHLLLPGHVDCCYKRIIDWMSEELQDKPLWLLTNYYPYMNIARLSQNKNTTDDHRSGLNRRISTDEITRAVDYARKKNIRIKTLDLLKPRPEMKEVSGSSQEIIIDDDGVVAFKYGDAMAVELGNTLASCHSERSTAK